MAKVGDLSADELLAKYSAIFYDSEIIAMVPHENEVRDPNLAYCEGWDDKEGMGISVVCAYDFVEQAYRIFLQDNLSELKTLINSREIIMGFNSDRFDNLLLEANDIIVPQAKSYDLWSAIVSTQPKGRRSGFTLDDMLRANNLPTKSGHGSDAPRWAQMGLWGKLIDYCIGDVRKGVQLVRLVINNVCMNPKVDAYIEVPKPWEVVNVDQDSIF